MNIFECPRCDYSSNKKSNVITHLRRKKVCPATTCNKPQDECIYFIKNGFKSGLSVMQEKVTALENKVQPVNNVINNTSNVNSNNVINNNTININMVIPYSEQPNMEYLKNIKIIGKSVKDLIKTLHCNPSHPENHNVYISDISRMKFMTFNGEKFTCTDSGMDGSLRFVNKLLDNLEPIALENDEVAEFIHDTFIRYNGGLLTTKELEKELRDLVCQLLYNSRIMIKSTNDQTAKDKTIIISNLQAELT
jgi:hypothetical protein